MSESGAIFISYRRQDSEDVAGRIYDRLCGHFPRDKVFFDIDTIPLGADFQEFIDHEVSQCQIFLAVIGKSWLTVTDEDGTPRLKLEEDFVRLEIESALKRNIPVIPLLVSGGRMPKKASLPSSLEKLIYRNGIQIRSGRDFHKDMDDLIAGIDQQFQKQPQQPMNPKAHQSAPFEESFSTQNHSFGSVSESLSETTSDDDIIDEEFNVPTKLSGRRFLDGLFDR